MKLLVFFLLSLSSAAQIVPSGTSYNPQAYINLDPLGNAHLVCNNLNAIPALMSFDCSNVISILNTIPGETIYFGFYNNQIHTSANYPLTIITCANCYQDSIPSPYVGEYSVGTITYVGSGILISYGWTGYPAIPNVIVNGCGSEVQIVYSARQIIVNCEQTLPPDPGDK